MTKQDLIDGIGNLSGPSFPVRTSAKLLMDNYVEERIGDTLQENLAGLVKGILNPTKDFILFRPNN